MLAATARRWPSRAGVPQRLGQACPRVPQPCCRPSSARRIASPARC